jgi:hypothetical protein
MMRIVGHTNVVRASSPIVQILDEERSEHAGWLGLAKWYWPSIFAQDSDPDKRHS